MAKKGRPFKHDKRRLIAEYLFANPSASIDDVCKAVVCSYSLVSKVRTELRLAGKIKPAYADRTSKPLPNEGPRLPPQPYKDILASDTPEVLETVSTRRLLDLVDAEQTRRGKKTLAPAEQEEMLIGFAHKDDESLGTRMAAMDRLNKLRGDQGGRDALGPGIPRTEEDMITRLTFLLKAVGFKLAVRAFESAFKQGEVNGEDIVAPDSSVSTETPIAPGPDDQSPTLEEEAGFNNLGHELGNGEAN